VICTCSAAAAICAVQNAGDRADLPVPATGAEIGLLQHRAEITAVWYDADEQTTTSAALLKFLN